MKFWDFLGISWFTNILSPKSFGSLQHNSHLPSCLLLIITLRFTCGKKNICWNIKKSQNILTMVVLLKVFHLKILAFGSFSDIQLYPIEQNWKRDHFLFLLTSGNWSEKQNHFALKPLPLRQKYLKCYKLTKNVT